MRSGFFALVMALLFSSSIQAQTIKNVDLTQKFNNYNVERIDVDQTLSMLRDDNFSLDLVIGDRVYSMALQNSGIIAENYSLTAIDDNGSTVSTTSRPRAYNGYLLGTSDSRVSLTFNKDFIYGFIREGEKTIYIEPLRHFKTAALSNEFITYDVADVITNSAHKCGVEKVHHKYKEQRGETAQQRVVGECFEVEWALVSDFLMFDDLGSIFAVEDHNIAVANDVQTNYDDEFADEIQYFIVEQQVFTTEASDPFTTSTDSGTLLDDFSNWGPSGFSQTHDVGSIWTSRTFNNGVLGVAWVGAICSNGFRYNALGNWTNNANSKRVMVAHELGHNFDAVHDASNSPHIMRPSVSTSTTWSTNSINDIENYYSFIGCLSSCIPTGSQPTADFLTSTIENCAPGSVVFTDISTGNPTNWEWSFPGGTPSTSTLENPTVTYSSPGTYNVSLEVSNSSGSDIINKPNEVEILGEPVAEWFVTTSLFQAFFTNTTTGGDSYFWDFGDDNFSSDETPNHTYDSDGVYTVTLTVTNECGSDMYTDDVNIVSVPTADFLASSTSGCAPLTVNYTNLSSSNTSEWDWEFEGGTPNTSTLSNPTVTYSEPGVYDVILTVSNSEGSDQIERLDFITVTEAAISDFSFVVDGGEVTFTNLSSNADSYSWDFGNGDSSTEESPVYTYTSSGTYTVELSAISECGTVTSTQDVMISLAPVAGFTTIGSTTDCAEFTLVFSDASTFNPTAWSWEFEGGNPATSTDQNPTVTYSTPGSFDVTLTVSNAQGMDMTTSEDYVVALDEVTAGFVFTNTALDVTFDNQSSEAGTSYVWDFGDGMTSISESPSYTYAEEGIYEVTLTSTGPCNSDVITETINLYTDPTAGFTSDVTDGCNALTVSYSQASSDNVTEYAWTFDGGTPATSTEANPTVVYNSAGTYSAELIVSNPVGNSSKSETDYITVSDIPTANFVAVNNMLSVTFTNNSIDAGSYLWDFGDGNTSTEISPTHTYSAEDDYTVTLTATNECGDDIFSNTVGANALPSANGSASITAICEGDEVIYTNLSSDNVSAWEWTFEGGTPATSTEQNPVVTYTSAGLYGVSLRVTASAGSDEISFADLIAVSALPRAEFIAVNNMQEVTFTNNSIGAATYSWDFGDGNTSVESDPKHVYEVEGNYEVVLTASNQCGDIMSTQTVVANSLPTANGGANITSGCGPTEIQFMDNSSDNVTSWLWTFEGGTPATSTEQNPLVTYDTPGVFDATLKVTSDAGSNEIVYSDYIIIDGLPTAEFDFVANDLEFAFTYTGEYADGFVWDFGDGNTSSEMSPLHTYAEYDMYTVSLRTFNVCSQDSTSQNIDIISNVSNLYTISDLKIFPNPTTDRFYVEMELTESIDMEMQIMDINGRIVQKQSLVNLGTQVNKTIDMSNEPSGTYLVRFINGDQVRNAKIVLSK